MTTDLQSLHTTLKLLSDPVRLRLSALLSIEELAVQELVTITGLAQSRVSNHLALLKRAGLVSPRKEGSWVFYCLVERGAGGPLSAEMFEATIPAYFDSDDGKRDLATLETVREQRRERSRITHDALADRWVEVGQEFQTGSLRAEACSALVPSGLIVADLGCGAGFLTGYLAGRGLTVIAVDHSEKMLRAARDHVGERVGDHVGERGAVEFRRGDMEALPLADHEVDGAFANLVWHHVGDIDRAATELGRILRPGGTAVITDLQPHDQDWMREVMGDHRLGMRPEDVRGALARVGFANLTIESIHDTYVVQNPDGDEVALPLFLVRGTAPTTD